MRKFRVVIDGKIVLFLNSRNYTDVLGISSLYTAVTHMLAKMNNLKVNGLGETIRVLSNGEYTNMFVRIDLEGKSRF